MTDRKFTCVACKSAVTKDDIEQSDLEFDGVLKATNQPEYTADADTDLVATIGTLDGYTHMVRTTGDQDITGNKVYLGQIEYKKQNYALFHTIVNCVTSLGATDNNASGVQYYGAEGLYLGRNCVTYNKDTNRASHDTRVNSIINDGIHARLYIDEKADGTFSLAFWNGTAWTTIVS